MVFVSWLCRLAFWMAAMDGFSWLLGVTWWKAILLGFLGVVIEEFLSILAEKGIK